MITIVNMPSMPSMPKRPSVSIPKRPAVTMPKRGSSSNKENALTKAQPSPVADHETQTKTRNLQKLKETIGVGGKPTVVTRLELHHALQKFKRLQQRLKDFTKNLEKQQECMSTLYQLREDVGEQCT